MEHMDLFVSLFKLYTNYIDVCYKNKASNEIIKRSMQDPLSGNVIETAKTTNVFKRKVQPSTSNEQKSKIPRIVIENRDSIDISRLTTFKKEDVIKKQNRSQRRFWVNKKFINRDIEGFYVKGFLKLKDENPDEFFDITRMELPIYNELYSLLECKLTSCSIRRPIFPECRLAVTLAYLSQGTPFAQLSSSFQIGLSTVRAIVYETCSAIWDVLSPICVKPLNANNYCETEEEFQRILDLPNCAGVFDSRILNLYSNSEKKQVALSFICNANKMMSWVDLSSYSNEYSENSDIIDSALKDITQQKLLPNTGINFPLYLIGDLSFPLKKNIMRPYSIKSGENDLKKLIFNDHLQRGRSISENTYGLLIRRWIVLQKDFTCYLDNARKVLLAIVALHNFIIMKSNEKNLTKYCPPKFIDWSDEYGHFYEGQWRKEISTLPKQAKFGSNNATRNDFVLRDILAEYLSQK